MHPHMRTVKTLFFASVFSFSCLAATPPADSNQANQVIQTALLPSPLEANLRRLTDEIGGRVPGTLRMQRRRGVGTAGHGCWSRQRSWASRDSRFRRQRAEGATEMMRRRLTRDATKVGGGTVVPHRSGCERSLWLRAPLWRQVTSDCRRWRRKEADFKTAGDISG
jgi:hypothetical protein